MTKLKEWFLLNFWTGYNMFEKLFLLIMLITQIVVFCIAPETPLGIVSGIAGVTSVVLCAKGKITFYFIGFIQTISYLILAWQNKFYGEVLENLFYLVTMIWGIFIWKKNLETNDDGTQDVKANKFTIPMWICSFIGTIVCTLIMGKMLAIVGSAQAYTDAATNVMAIFAQLLMVRRYREQWVWWLIIDLLCIKMWFIAGNWSLVAMYIAWTANCVYGWMNWSKLNQKQTNSNLTLAPSS